jgi:hypothetical protein
LFAIFFVPSLLAAVGCGLPAGTPKPSTPEKPPERTVTAKKNLSVTAAALTKECDAGRDAARKKYAGRVLTVEGVVNDPSLEGTDGNPRITLAGFEAPHFVNCYCNQTGRGGVTKLSKGQKVKLTGRFVEASAIDVTLLDCEIVELGPSSGSDISAIKLTEEFSKDEKAAVAKYGGKIMVIEGVVARVALEPGKGIRSAYLEGYDERAAKPVRVNAEFHFDHAEELATLKPGQKVKVKGECQGELDGSVYVSKAVLVK